ncbi:MAG: ParB/RepB/Spo0J family partition protein [Oscillospiraceae bacterium]|jgi:ParB family chromosome partitioning protein|nr:ParB/RepB/Spo0J family partition protein [Oscillospiraceae bacterium]
MPTKKFNLGRGLDSLFDTGLDERAATLPILEVEPNREQPRQDFDEIALAELSRSVAEHGVLQPILVRPVPGGAYQIIAGERRWRAARAAGLTEIPVVIKELSDEETMVAALIENLQREDLNPMEEARGYRSLMEEYNLTQDETARRVGKSRSAVANALRLLNLPGAVQELVRDQKLTEGHARALMGLEQRAGMAAAAQEIAEKGLNVRESEKLVKRRNEAGKPPPDEAYRRELLSGIPPPERPPQIFEEVRLSVSEALGRKVKIIPRGDGGGQLVLDFYSPEELMEMARALGGG